jgi:hypothetical protein
MATTGSLNSRETRTLEFLLLEGTWAAVSLVSMLHRPVRR